MPSGSGGSGPAPIFISYRRKDAGGYAALLANHLRSAIGKSAVFFDERSIPKGSPSFPGDIEQALKSASAVVLVVGSDWADILKARSREPDRDWVLHEVVTALALRNQPSGPKVFVTLVGGAAMPRASSFPAKWRTQLAPMADIDAHVLCGSDWTNDAVLADLVAKIRLALPLVTGKLDQSKLDSIAKEASTEILSQLDPFVDLADIKQLRDAWVLEFNNLPAFMPAKALVALRSKLDAGRSARRLNHQGLSSDRADSLRSALLVVVAELLRLGACRIALAPEVLGDGHSPAQLESLATHLLAWAGCEGRSARIAFDPGTAGQVRKIRLTRSQDIGAVNAGILEDQQKLILNELWALVPEFDGLDPTYPARVESPSHVRDLAVAIRGLNEQSLSRITLGLVGSTASAVGADLLREWLQRMKLDVDVIVRDGCTDADHSDAEHELNLNAWLCLGQIKGVGGDAPKK
jgi:hypothetical protein